MPLTVLRAKVKDACGIADSGSDALIDALILDLVPVIEFQLEPSHLASAEAGLVATLNRGATEVVAGETLAVLARKPGGSDRVRVGGLELSPAPSGDDLLRAGWQRLERFRRDLGSYRPAGVIAVAVPPEDS